MCATFRKLSARPTPDGFRRTAAPSYPPAADFVIDETGGRAPAAALDVLAAQHFGRGFVEQFGAAHFLKPGQ